MRPLVQCSLTRPVLVVGALIATMAATRWLSPRAGSAPQYHSVADTIRSLEQLRVRALVAADTLAAGRLLASDFVLITPTGAPLARQQYLVGLASGRLRYAAWEPESLNVRTYQDGAVVTYRSRLVMIVQTASGPDTAKPFPHWHTDVYERRPSGWQAVWSQATHIGK